MKKDYFLLLDTETTMNQQVADFGALVVDRKGEIFAQCAVLIAGIYNDRKGNPLFFNELAGEIWNKKSLDTRYEKYDNMLDKGVRMLASVNAVNKWLANVKGKYNPMSTAYNLAFDKDKCYNTDIDINMFSQEFCLMKASQDKWMHTKKYRQFILDNHFFNNPTKLRNMSFSYKAEVMVKFILNYPDMPDEPHTAIEDARDYELPILIRLLQTQKRDKWLNPKGFSWQASQVKDWYMPK